MEMTVITADVDYKTAEFFQKYGDNMDVPAGEVLNRLLVSVSASSVDEAVSLVMWYYEAMASNNTKEQRLGTLYIFTVLCMTLVDEIAPARTVRTEIKLTGKQPCTTLKLAVVNETAYVFNKIMSDYGLTAGGAVRKAIDDFLDTDDKMQPYRLVNYMISAALNLIRPQARMSVILTINACIDRICELSDCDRETVVGKLRDMKSFALQNADTAENVRLLRNTGFYKEKLQ